LISVNERPSGGAATPYYQDGIKYYNRMEAEEYAATLEAYTYPVEFEECDGTVEMAPGFYAMHQNRKPFALCYRSGIGNVLNPSAGYKLHLIYNVMAEPSEQSHQTLTDDPEIVSFSWSLSAIPTTVPGAKPTAHLVIDSTRLSLELLDQVEDIVYGTIETAPRMPTADELLSLSLDLPEGTFTAEFGAMF
jgi:tRNA-binding EMAP/Myf-like protein